MIETASTLEQCFALRTARLAENAETLLPNEIGGPAILADLFASHFTGKIDSIRCQIPMPSANVYNAHARVILSPLLAFQPASLEEVTSLIQNGKIKTSNIDPLPSAILKANTSTVPASMKHAVITPLLKRSGLSADDYSSYRPISNLPYASKLLERHVSAQLRLHLQSNDLEDPFQSAYRRAHSVEPAIVCIQDDILRSLDMHKHVVLVLLDLSAAFYTIDHDILLIDLHRIGVRGDALCWLASYLTDRTQCVSVDGHSSHRTRLRHGVPQGSVLGPLLFTVYCAGLSYIFEMHGVRYHVYADDTQLYVDFPPNDSASAADQISRCVIDVKAWLASRYLLLNEAKTETILFTTPNHRTPHRHLWTQRYHFGQHSRPWRAPRFNFVDDLTRKPYLPDCLRPTSLYSANTICANPSSMQDTCSCVIHIAT